MVNQQQLHKRQLKSSNETPETNYNTTCTKGKNTQWREYCVQFFVIVFFLQSLIHSCFHPSLSLLITLLLLLTFSIKTRSSPPPPILHFTSPHSTSLCFFHFTSLYCTSLHSTLNNFSLNFRLFNSLYAASLQFLMISSTLYFLLIQLSYHFPYPLFKSNWFAGENS